MTSLRMMTSAVIFSHIIAITILIISSGVIVDKVVVVPVGTRYTLPVASRNLYF